MEIFRTVNGIYQSLSNSANTRKYLLRRVKGSIPILEPIEEDACENEQQPTAGCDCLDSNCITVHELVPPIYIRARYMCKTLQGTVQERFDEPAQVFISTDDLMHKLAEYASKYSHSMGGKTAVISRKDIGQEELMPDRKLDEISFWVEIKNCRNNTLQGQLICKGCRRIFRDEWELFWLMGSEYIKTLASSASDRKWPLRS